MLKVTDVARELGVHQETVRRYARKGLLTCFRDFHNHRIFDPDDVKKVKERMSAVAGDSIARPTDENS
jgi:DNA-binding transcriptional MerR regulator